MNPGYPGPPPGYQPGYHPGYQRRPWTDFLPLIIGAVGIVGLGSTLLPMWTLSLQADDLGIVDYDIDEDGEFVSSPRFDGAASVDIGFYDWILSAAPVAAIMPIVFALAIAVSAAALLCADDRRLWAATSVGALCAVFVVTATAIRPQWRHDVTGPLALELTHTDLRTITEPAPMDVGIGAGVALTLVALIAVGVLAGWQFVVTSRRGTAAP